MLGFLWKNKWRHKGFFLWGLEGGKLVFAGVVLLQFFVFWEADRSNNGWILFLQLEAGDPHLPFCTNFSTSNYYHYLLFFLCAYRWYLSLCLSFRVGFVFLLQILFTFQHGIYGSSYSIGFELLEILGFFFFFLLY